MLRSMYGELPDDLFVEINSTWFIYMWRVNLKVWMTTNEQKNFQMFVVIKLVIFIFLFELAYLKKMDVYIQHPYSFEFWVFQIYYQTTIEVMLLIFDYSSLVKRVLQYCWCWILAKGVCLWT